MSNEYLLAQARFKEETATRLEAELKRLPANVRAARLATIEGMRNEANGLRWEWKYGQTEFLKTPFGCLISHKFTCGAPQFRQDGQLVCLANGRCAR